MHCGTHWNAIFEFTSLTREFYRLRNRCYSTTMFQIIIFYLFISFCFTHIEFVVWKFTRLITRMNEFPKHTVTNRYDSQMNKFSNRTYVDSWHRPATHRASVSRMTQVGHDCLRRPRNRDIPMVLDCFPHARAAREHAHSIGTCLQETSAYHDTDHADNSCDKS